MTMHEPFLSVFSPPLQVPSVKERMCIRMRMHEPLLIVAQRLLTTLLLPPEKERKFDHTHDNA
jgi:hypothetical protein